jgi:hypothetical protein
MKTNFLAVIYLICCLVLEPGCRNHTARVEKPSENTAFRDGNDTPVFYCWFVEDNGAGHTGYVLFGAFWDRPLLPNEPLFSTVEEVREALKNESKFPFLVPQHPNWVPEGWRVRDLNSNEVNRLRAKDGQ